MAPERLPITARFAALGFGSKDRARRHRRTAITAIDFDAGWLHVVEGVLRGAEARVARHAAVPLDPPANCKCEDAALLGAAVRRSLVKLQVDPGPVAMGVPRSQVILRILSLPPARQESEIAAMVHFQVSRDLPFRIEDAVLDYQVLPPSPSPGSRAETPAGTGSGPSGASPDPAPATRVLAAVVRRETVEFHAELARAAGLRLQVLGLRPLAVGRAAALCAPEAALGCVAIVSIEGGGLTFDVLVDGTLVFSRTGTLPAPAERAAGSERPVGAPDAGAVPVDAERVAAAILEASRSLHSYEGAAGHGRVGAFLVAGATGLEASIAEALARRFGLPARRLDPAAALSPTAGGTAHADGALPAIGLALGALDVGGVPLDFLAPKRPPAPRDDRRVRRLAAVAAGLAVLLSIAGLRAHWIRGREEVRRGLQEQVALASKNLAGYRTVRAQARTLADWSAQGRNWLDYLTLLSTLLPPSRELYLTALSTTARNGLSLSVRVRSGETIDRLSADLRAAGFAVRPPGITPVNDRFGYRFQANLEIDVPARITNNLDQVVVESRPPRGAPAAAASAVASPTPTADAAKAPAPEPSRVEERREAASSPAAEDRPFRRGRRRPEGGSRE